MASQCDGLDVVSPCAPLKIINNAAHELHANDLAKASRFNLSILHRRGAPAVESTPPAPTPAAG